MGTNESNKFDAYHNLLEPKDEAPNKPLHWSSTFQTYYNSGSTPTPLLYPQTAGSYRGHYVWPNQVNNTMPQYDFLHEHMNLHNNFTVAGIIINQQQPPPPNIFPLATDAALIFSEKVRTMFGGNNLDSMKQCDRNLQSKSLKTKESKENENKCSAPSNDKDGVSESGASERKESPEEIHDTKNVLPPTKKQKRMMLENANSTEQNKNLGTGLNASSSDVQPTKLEEDELRKERKRQSNRESAKRSRMQKQKECEELLRDMVILKGENSAIIQRLKSLSEECMELHNENDSIQEQLVKMYGEESIADLLPMKPA